MLKSKKKSAVVEPGPTTFKYFSTMVAVGNQTPEEIEEKVKKNINRIAKEKGYKKSDFKDLTVKLIPKEVDKPASTYHNYQTINCSPEFMTDNYKFRNKAFVPFEILIASELDELYCQISPKEFPSEEVRIFITNFVTVMTKEIYVDIKRIVEKAEAYLELSSIFVYSRDRCYSYYNILLMIISRVDVLSFTTKMLKYRLFNIPIPNDGTCDDDYYDRYMDEVSSIENMYNDFISKDNLLALQSSSDIYEKHPFIIEDAFTKLIENINIFKELIDVGLRLSLEYKLTRLSEFCIKDCCKMPEKMII